MKINKEIVQDRINQLESRFKSLAMFESNKEYNNGYLEALQHLRSDEFLTLLPQPEAQEELDVQAGKEKTTIFECQLQEMNKAIIANHKRLNLVEREQSHSKDFINDIHKRLNILEQQQTAIKNALPNIPERVKQLEKTIERMSKAFQGESEEESAEFEVGAKVSVINTTGELGEILLIDGSMVFLIFEDVGRWVKLSELERIA